MKITMPTETRSLHLSPPDVFLRRLREALTDVQVEMAMVSAEASHWVGGLPAKPELEAYFLRGKLATLADKCEVARAILARLDEISEDRIGAWLNGLVRDDGELNW